MICIKMWKYWDYIHGMDHNEGTSEEDEVKLYIERDQSSNRPYKIIRNDSVGRYMVATRDIKPGETVLMEYPLTFGPGNPNEPICLGCYTPVLKNQHTECDGCGFPMCSKECSQILEHKDFECAEMHNMNFRLDSQNTLKWNGSQESVYNAISPMRALVLKKRDPARWNLIWMHMSHDEARQKDTFWQKKDAKTLEHIKAMMKISPEDYDTIKIILGIFLVNDFEICIPLEGSEEKSSLIRGIFALASMPNHSCVSNCYHNFTCREEGFKMTMKAVVDIKEGDEITHSYTEPLDPIMRRQSLLKIGKFFQCNCIRCRDPTEMSTYSSALICSKCKKGNVISKNCKNINSDWECDSCDLTLSPDSVEQVNSKAKSEIEEMDKNPDVETHEQFLNKYATIFHPNHVYMIDRSYVLGKMYGRMEGYEPDSLSDDQFMRKKELCERVLKVLNVITPGQTRKKGMMMYELHLPFVIMGNRALQKGPNGNVDPQEIKKNLRMGLDYLKKGIKILGEEPSDSFEYKIFVSSQESVKQLEEWVTKIESVI
ncbi:SET domain-containing protein SmydA-8 isoform X1 [Lepeophtheirus salmonis]|uniref:SET domain-containing protein SmydA-8 isoform X1 n=2 Tax=Lepeophtheirus salmonis TaxID=72036 RepID=UPI001AEB6830|nr:SET domain-containing protein SmydA-8-like isoform X1 [Lepeophtheirus salmonis]